MSGLEGLLEGKVLVNRYRIEQVIGRGGFAAVYSAADERLGRTVAVKVITLAAPDPELHEHLRERFQREARSAAGLPQHPNVVTVYDFGTDPKTGIDFLVMELLRGEDLASRLSREPRLPMDLALRILREAVEGIAVGHRAGLVHRDVKPGNVFLAEPLTDEPFRVCVLDFGIAVVVAEQGTAQRLTQQGSAPLSPAYASPEQLAGEQELTCASDVFSLGVLAYQLLTGERPFAAERRRGAGGWDVLPLRERNPEVPQAVADVVHRALVYAPGDRYEHAAAMGAALDAASGAAAPRTVAAAATLVDDDDRTIVAPSSVIAAAAGAGAAHAATSPEPVGGDDVDDGDRTLLSSERPTPPPAPVPTPPPVRPVATAEPARVVEPVPTRVAPAKKSKALPIALFAALVLAGGAGAAVMLGRGDGDKAKDTKAVSDTAAAAPTTVSGPGSASPVSTGSEVPMSTGGTTQPSPGGAVTQPSAPDNGAPPPSDGGQPQPAPSEPPPSSPSTTPAPASPSPQPSTPAPAPTTPRPAPAQPAPTRPAPAQPAPTRPAPRPAPPVNQPAPQPQPAPPPAPAPQPPPDTAHMNPVPQPAPRDTLKLQPVAPPPTITIPPPADTMHRR